MAAPRAYDASSRRESAARNRAAVWRPPVSCCSVTATTA